MLSKNQYSEYNAENEINNQLLELKGKYLSIVVITPL